MSNNSSASNSSLYLNQCFEISFSWHVYVAFTFTNTLLILPLSVFVLILGFRRWRQQRSVSSAAAMSLSDFVTYNMAVMELIGILGNTIGFWSLCAELPAMFFVGYFLWAFPWSGQMFFPILTCVERYLAVVHPITYLRLRKVGGVRIRNVSTGIVWLLCFPSVGFVVLVLTYPEYSLIPYASVMTFLIITVTFCSLPVLCVLNRPRPGEAGGDRVRVDQSKQRAFHAIVIITGVLLLRFGGSLVCSTVAFSPRVSYSVQCVAQVATGWFSLPCSLALPLLFLHRAGKASNESG